MCGKQMQARLKYQREYARTHVQTHTRTRTRALTRTHTLQVFDFFDVDKYILFSTFNTICERTINEAGDVRTAVCGLVGTGASFLSKAEKSDEPPRRKIALIDEVDVFFSRSFYGQVPTPHCSHMRHYPSLLFFNPPRLTRTLRNTYPSHVLNTLALLN